MKYLFILIPFITSCSWQPWIGPTTAEQEFIPIYSNPEESLEDCTEEYNSSDFVYLPKKCYFSESLVNDQRLLDNTRTSINQAILASQLDNKTSVKVITENIPIALAGIIIKEYQDEGYQIKPNVVQYGFVNQFVISWKD